MPKNLTETDIYSPSITSVDINNDVPNQQLANRTLYLKTSLEALKNYLATYKTDHTKEYKDLKNKVDKLSTDLTILSNTSSAMDEKSILAQLKSITTDVSVLQNGLKTHTHMYAGGKKPGGDANSVDVITDNLTEYNLIGSMEAMPNKLRRNSKISIENDTLKAPKIVGDLEGIADKAKQLNKSITLTLTGDVLGSVQMDGSNDIIINTNIRTQSVNEGEYGTIGDMTLGTSGSFTVPDITVNSMGLVTDIHNRTITLPNNLGINGITSSLPTNKKIFVLGTSEQANKASTYTQNLVYIDEHHLYSNGKEVVNLTDYQALKNKTYEGYVLGDACARGVDETVGGSPDDNRLTTSNALYRHKHNYALADSIDGRSLYSKIDIDNDNINYLVVNNDKKGALKKNTNIYVKGTGLYSKDLYATQNMYIPGGKIWIDSNKVPIDEEAWNGNADIAKDTTGIARTTQIVKLNPSYRGTNATDIKIHAGDLLVYKPSGYEPANNKNNSNCDNIVLATTDGLSQDIAVMYSGRFDLGTTSHNGQTCYVGDNGKISYVPITTTGRVCKKIGYVEGNMLIFNPNTVAIINV